MNRYRLLSFGNFLAAIGGATVLGKGILCMHQDTVFEDGSVLAFFVGTVLGMAFLLWIPKRWSGPMARWFSIGGAVSSLALLCIFATFAVDGKLAGAAAAPFFALLSIRFGLWFYSRVLRAATVADQRQRIAWIELGYYVGMVVGLVVWKILGLDFGMVVTLVLDASLQLAAGIIDLSDSKDWETKVDNESAGPEVWRLIGAVVFLTIGIQVVTFSLSHEVTRGFGPYVLGVFYFGVAAAAYICHKFTVQFDSGLDTKSGEGRASIQFHYRCSSCGISFFLIASLGAASLAFAILGFEQWKLGTVVLNQRQNLTLDMLGWGEWLLLVCVGIAALFYETLALALLDRIGKQAQGREMIYRTFGLMGIAAAVSLWILGFAGRTGNSWAFMLGICMAVSFWSVWNPQKRLRSRDAMQTVVVSDEMEGTAR